MRRFVVVASIYAVLSANSLAQSVSDYPSPQAAIDANPGKMIFVPNGDYLIDKKLRIAADNTGLYGFGRIVQANPAEPVLEIEHASGVRIENITLTRADGTQDATSNGIFCWDSRNVEIDRVRIVNCRAREAAVEIRASKDVTVRNCQILNYKRIAIDDRTAEGETHYGYAFWAIDGTGILVNESTGTSLLDNRILEENLMPTPETKEKFKLGTFTEGKYPSKEGDLAHDAFKKGYVDNWHQGSAIVVTSPEVTRDTIVRGNQIRNAAQGIDLHCDNALITENVIDYCMIGVKATHGCRNLTVSKNLISHVDLWGILLNPGAVSHAAEQATEGAKERAQNVDAGTILANNTITEYGYGNEYWNWGGRSKDQGGSYAIALYEGQLPSNPPLTDVLIQGNMVYSSGRDGILVEGKVVQEPPRYRYAVYVGPWGEGREKGPTYPQGMHFADNLFHAGTAGVSNIELTP
ncbi:MAG: right-handed parallel beta-helix repeat-containing protein [Candidatus Hydrogenedentes bacterium]|nr:right-handed parallel beta-helix repeat-containing protein [Candidatus Hydrogenedentota bacterium]